MEIFYFVFGPIYSLIIGKFINKIFRKKTAKEVLELNNGRLIELLEKRDATISKLDIENKKKEIEKLSIFQSIQKSGLLTEKLIAEYNRPINAILICTYFQKIPDGTLYGKDEKFVFKELQCYNAKSLGGGIFLIPPKNVPKKIHDKNSLHKWFSAEVLKDRYCKLKFLLLVDLRENAYWMNNLPYQPPNNRWHKIHRNIGEVLSPEDIFSEGQISRTTTIAKIISNGDIGWLAHKHVSEDDLAILRLNQLAMENRIGKPSLRELVEGDYQGKLKTVLEEYGIHNSEEVAKSIISEAKFWHSRLK